MEGKEAEKGEIERLAQLKAKGRVESWSSLNRFGLIC